MARAADILFQLEENDEGVIAILNNHGNQFKMIDRQPPKIKVVGFNKAPISKEMLYSRAQDEAFSFSEGEFGFLKIFISSQDAQISQQIIEIRRAIRKAAIFIDAKKVAIELLNEINRS